MTYAQRLRDLAARTGLDGFADELRAMADEMDAAALRPAAQPAHVHAPVASAAGNDAGPEVLRQIFALCETTEEAELSASSVDSQAAQDFMRGRKFEAKQIRRAIGTWFQDEFCGRSFMGEPVGQQLKDAP